MKKFFCALLAEFLLFQCAAAAQSVDRVADPIVKRNGGLQMLKGLPDIGSYQNGKFISQPDVVQIQGEGSTGDVSETSVKSRLGTRARLQADRFADTPTLADFGAPVGGDWTAALLAAEASAAPRIFLPAGSYPVTLTRFQAIGKAYVGPGRLIMGANGSGQGGAPEAQFRSFITENPLPSGVEFVGPFAGVFNFDATKQYATAYTSVSASATPPNRTSYTLMPQLSQTVRVYESAAGFQTNLANQTGGRSGTAMDWKEILHVGQGDLGGEYTRIEVRGDTPNATHFLAKPASAFRGGDIAAGSGTGDGKYLQISEHNIYDNGTAAAAVGNVINYHRTNSGKTLSQFWIHDRPQAPIDPAMAIDGFYVPSGAARRGIDFTGADLSAGNEAAIILRYNQRIYFGGFANADPAGLVTTATSLGAAQMYMDITGKLHIDAGATQAVVLDNLPTSASGLPTNAVYKDVNGFLKVAP